MNQFYASIMFLGIMLIAVSLLWIFIDRKKNNDYEKRIDSKKEELENIISYAEEMIEELNKFSDYIVTQMDLKNEELFSNLKEFDRQMHLLSEKANEQYVKREAKSRKAVNAENHSSDLLIDKLDRIPRQSPAVPAPSLRQKKVEKVIPINSRHKRILELAQDGLSATEIAKNLKMGKGEIQLILELNKGE